MKRNEQCPECGGSGRDAERVAKHEAHDVPGGHAEYDGPAQCDRCAGTGRVGEGYRDMRLLIPHDHPHRAEIEALLNAEGPRPGKGD